MASKFGKRPEGSDGSDFWHRESIAGQYKVSTENKSRLRLDLFFHFVTGFMMFIRLLPALTAFFGMSVKMLRRWDLPAPRSWEYAWFISVVAAVLGWKSTPHNQIFLIKQYMLGSVVFGIFPVIFGFIDVADDLGKYYHEKKYTYVMFGYPAVIVWFLFLLVAVQLHIFGLYFGTVLVKAWRPRVVKPKEG
ncbi:protein jagunal-like [Haliotis rubra]|uniref:protein jagunal-like n=1 Tax=Haliotis rubra TaxID=36100 RepID=UPI001EE5B6FD|nr:protein jagunal-like [Haliotis rubra]